MTLKPTSNIREKYARDELYGVAELKRFGWTDWAISRFLPAPDDTRRSPNRDAGPRVKLWLKDRVHSIEKTPAFLAWQAGTAGWRLRAARAVETRMARLAKLRGHVIADTGAGS
jgi:hypothetical protein